MRSYPTLDINKYFLEMYNFLVKMECIIFEIGCIVLLSDIFQLSNNSTGGSVSLTQTHTNAFLKKHTRLRKRGTYSRFFK